MVGLAAARGRAHLSIASPPHAVEDGLVGRLATLPPLTPVRPTSGFGRYDLEGELPVPTLNRRHSFNGRQPELERQFSEPLSDRGTATPRGLPTHEQASLASAAVALASTWSPDRDFVLEPRAGRATRDAARLHPAASSAPPTHCRSSQGGARQIEESSQSRAHPGEHDDCFICLEPLLVGERVRILPCHHQMHARCAAAWLQYSTRATCPACRAPVPHDHKKIVTLAARSPGRGEAHDGAQTWKDAPLLPALGLEEPDEAVVRRLMRDCWCSQAMAVSAAREAEALGSRADEVAAACMAEHGRVLLAAIRENDVGAAERLLKDRGADLDVRESEGPPRFRKTPLMLAVQKRLGFLVRTMCCSIEEGIAGPFASIDAQDDQGFTALMWASIRGYPELVGQLLAHGATADLRNKDGLTALNLTTHVQVRELLAPVPSPRSFGAGRARRLQPSA